MSFRKILLAVTSVVLLWLAVPNFLAAVSMAVGDPIMRDLTDGKRPSPSELETLIESREQAIEFADLSKASTELGIIYVMQDPTPENIEKALASLQHSLDKAPMNAITWQWFARLAIFSPGREQDAVVAWRTARMLAENDMYIFHDRIHVGVLVYREMEQQDRDNLFIDVERAYRTNRARLRDYAKRQNILEWMKFILRDEEKTKYLSS